jgi:hypothetical protein
MKVHTGQAQARPLRPKVARLYHFEPETIQHIEFLAHLFGGKEKAIAAAVEIASRMMRGQDSQLRISVKKARAAP